VAQRARSALAQRAEVARHVVVEQLRSLETADHAPADHRELGGWMRAIDKRRDANGLAVRRSAEGLGADLARLVAKLVNENLDGPAAHQADGQRKLVRDAVAQHPRLAVLGEHLQRVGDDVGSRRSRR
jgi:hypothetical protein